MGDRYIDILPDDFDFRPSLEETQLRQTFSEICDALKNKKSYFGDCIADQNIVLDGLAFIHVGFPAPFQPESAVQFGTELAQYFIRGEWRDASPEEARAAIKKPNNKKFEWFPAFRRGIFVTLLSDREEALKELANWVEPWMKPDGTLAHLHPMYARLYVLICNAFRDTPFMQEEVLPGGLKSCRKKEPKLLITAWLAALAGDQGAFDQAIQDCVHQFERTTHTGYVPHPKDCIAFDASVVLAAGRRMGMRLPSFEPPVRARLLTPESVSITNDS